MEIRQGTSVTTISDYHAHVYFDAMADYCADNDRINYATAILQAALINSNDAVTNREIIRDDF